jgi:hypothetical protein
MTFFSKKDLGKGDIEIIIDGESISTYQSQDGKTHWTTDGNNEDREADSLGEAIKLAKEEIKELKPNNAGSIDNSLTEYPPLSPNNF